MIQTIIGEIVGATRVEHFTDNKGKSEYKCFLHIRANNDEKFPQELAVCVLGDDTNYAYCVGMKVKVDYIVKVFEAYRHNGEYVFANNVFAKEIKRVVGG